MPVDLANGAAATAAGYKLIQRDRGTTAGVRYESVYEKFLSGGGGQSGWSLRAEGESNVDQATADAAALTALNAQRRHRYGTTAAVNNDGKGGSHTVDVT